MSDRAAEIWAELALHRLIRLEGERRRNDAIIAGLREQLALRDARIAALEEAVRHILDDIRPTLSPGSATVGNHAITGLKNAMFTLRDYRALGHEP